MTNTEDKILSWKKEYTEEKTKADVDNLRSMFNIPAEDYEEAYKIFDDKFKSEEKERIIRFIEGILFLIMVVFLK